MANFPTLNTGAVAQYPTPLNTGQGAHVIRFLDGSDQRYVTQARMLRSWHIQLNLLNEAEIQQLERFFSEQEGDYSVFTFPDPFSGAAVPNCRFGSGGLLSEYVGVDAANAELWVIETNG
jgi:hypothetical protein